MVARNVGVSVSKFTFKKEVLEIVITRKIEQKSDFYVIEQRKKEVENMGKFEKMVCQF